MTQFTGTRGGGNPLPRYNRLADLPDAPRSTRPHSSLLHFLHTRLSVNVFYEEEGALKVASILADNDTSLQVEAPHGKRSKIKAARRCSSDSNSPRWPTSCRRRSALRRSSTSISSGNARAARSSTTRSSPRNTYGHKPAPVESAAVLLKLHGAPMYFYKRGRGRYRAAPAEALKAALASVERKKREAARKEAYVGQLVAGDASGRAPVDAEHAAVQAGSQHDRVESAGRSERATEAHADAGDRAQRRAAVDARLPSEPFPLRALPARQPASACRGGVRVPADLPLADAAAFSIDDASTTEIDDAFSVTIARQRQHARSAFTSRRLRSASRQTLRSTRLRVRACRPSISPAARSPCFRTPLIEAYTLASGRILPGALALRRSERGESDREHATRSSSG